MNTAIITTEWAGGGTEKYCLHLAAAHRYNGWNPHLFVEKNKVKTICPETSVFESIVELHASAKEMEQQFKTRSIKLIHLNVWSNPNRYKFCEGNFGIPTIQTFHATFPDIRARTFLRIWRVGQIYRKLLFIRKKLVPKVPLICISKQNLERAQIAYPRLPKCLIYNGVPELISKGQANGPMIWVGSFTKRKNPKLALDIVEQLKKTGDHVKLEMIGDGPLLEKCKEEAIARSLPIEFPGRIANAADSLNGKSVLLLTSRDEGIPYVISEAFAASIPVITTSCGAVTEIVNSKNGFICNNSDGFVHAVKKILRKEAYEKFASAAKKTHQIFFKIEDYYNKTSDFSKQIINESPISSTH